MKPSSPLGVTVVIPSYGRQEEVNMALASIVAQSRRPDAVIVVDDASPVPLEIPPHISNRVPVTLLRQPKNMGPTLALNRAIAEVRTEVIAFLDSDDVYAPHYIETLLNKWSGAPEDVGLVVTSFYHCMSDLKPYRMHRQNSAPITRERLLQRGNYLGGTSAYSVRTKAARAVGGFAVSPGSYDWLFALRILTQYRIEVLDTPLMYYRSPNDTSDNQTRKYRRQAIALSRIYREGRGEGGVQGRATHAQLLARVLLIGNRRRLAAKVLPLRPLRAEVLLLLAFGPRNTRALLRWSNWVRAHFVNRVPRYALQD